MNIKQKFKAINSDTFIEDYLREMGVKNINLYLNPTYDCIEPPENYDNMEEAKELLKRVMSTSGKIGILVDSDYDGTCSASLMYNFLNRKDIEVFFHDSKQHGLNDNKVFAEICDAKLDLLIIPDAGSNDFEQIKQLSDIGTEVIVLDHHHSDKYSPYGIIINNQLSDMVSNKSATGTMVTWQFCRYINEPRAKDFIDICAWSIVSDVVDITTYENRAVIYYGLQNTNNPLLVAMVKEFNNGLNPTQTDLGWTLLPKINSIIRTDNTDDTKALFYAMTNPTMTVQWQKGVRAKVEEWNMIDRVIEQCKTSQKKQADLTKKFVEEIEPKLDANAKIIIGFAGEELGTGYTGLVAGKISDKYNKPCLLLRDTGDSYAGSLRSSVDIREILDNNEFVVHATGHERAAGIEILKDHFDDFKQFITTLNLSNDPVHDVLYSFDYNSIPDELFEAIEFNKGLFGKGLPSPLFHIKPFVINSSDIVMMGNNTTLKIPLGNLSAIKFFCSKKIREEFLEGQGVDIEVELIVELSINYWSDTKYNQLLIKDYSVKPAEIKNWDDLF